MELELWGITGIAAITVICYLIAELVKATPLDNKWLPAICGLSGAALGAAGLYIMPEFPAADMINAIAVGIASGLAATGANQIYKQLARKEE